MSDDPAVRAAIEATRNHQQTGSTCSCGHPCGDFFYEHVNAVAVEAARPIIEAPLRNEIRRLYGNAPIHPLPGAADNGDEAERRRLDQLDAYYRAYDEHARRAADNGEPKEDPADESVTESGPPSCMEPKYHVGGSLPSGVTQQILETFGVTQAEVDAVRAVERGEITWDQLGAADNGQPALGQLAEEPGHGAESQGHGQPHPHGGQPHRHR